MFASAAAKRLWGLFLLHGVLVTGILLATGRSQADTLVRPARFFLDVVLQQSDSWRPMQTAADYLAGPHDGLVYDAMLVDRGVKFQYPLSSLLFTRHFSTRALNILSWWAVAFVMIASWAALWKASRGTPLAFDRADVMVILGVVALALTFYPLVQGFALGQIQTWINAAFALAVLALLSGREDLAGLAIGLACLIKPTYLLIAIWAVARRRWKLLGPMTAVVLLGALAAVVVYGWAENANYLHALSLIGRHGETFFPNQSINGLLNRLLGNGDSLKFDRAAFAPFHPVVYGGTLAAAAVLIGLALWAPRRSPRAGSALDFGLFALTITLTSPVAWDHHYGLVFPILAAAAPVILMRRPFGHWTTPALVVSYVAMGQSILATNVFAGSWLGVLQSYQLFGGLLLLALMYGTLRGDRHDAARV